VQLSIQSAFTLAAGDTAVVVLFGGIATGPIQEYGYFDLVNLVNITAVSSTDQTALTTIGPNPAHDLLTIYNPIPQKLIVTIADINGKVLKCFSSDIVNLKQQIDISSLHPGIYFVRLSFNNSLVMKKFIKQ
jgi:hypothetical protein